MWPEGKQKVKKVLMGKYPKYFLGSGNISLQIGPFSVRRLLVPETKTFYSKSSIGPIVKLIFSEPEKPFQLFFTFLSVGCLQAESGASSYFGIFYFR